MLQDNPRLQNNSSYSNTTRRPRHHYYLHQRSSPVLPLFSGTPPSVLLFWLAMRDIDYASVLRKGRFGVDVLQLGAWNPVDRRRRAARKSRIGKKQGLCAHLLCDDDCDGSFCEGRKKRKVIGRSK